MRSINDSLFQKNKIYDLNSVVGGTETIQHDPTWRKDTGHYVCDDIADPVNEQ